MPKTQKHTILLVDDEGSITKSLQRLLRKQGFNMLSASTGEEGLKVLSGLEMPVSLIISDQRMPGMQGSEFLEKAKKIFPDAIRILLTGYSDMDAIIDAVNKGEIHRYLTKPWDDRDFIFQVQETIKKYELVQENKRLLVLTKKQNKELKNMNVVLEKKVQERTREIVKKNKELEAGLFNSVRAFASLAEMNIPSQSGHGRRVALLSREIVKYMELAEKEATSIEIAALLHDIGKLGLPPKLLDYNEKDWTKEDIEMYEHHPAEGQTAVSFINNLELVGIYIRSHHERYDGQGYPDHLNEKDIPIGSKIIAVADAYDKIINLKVNSQRYINEYIKASKYTQDHLSESDILYNATVHHLKANAFTLYDPDVIKCFLNYLNSKGMQPKKNRVVTLNHLKEGMVLVRSLYTSKGRFLLPHNTVITNDHIEKLRLINNRDPIRDEILVVDKK